MYKIIYVHHIVESYLEYSRGDQTTALGQNSARQDIFKCPLKIFWE